MNLNEEKIGKATFSFTPELWVEIHTFFMFGKSWCSAEQTLPHE